MKETNAQTIQQRLAAQIETNAFDIIRMVPEALDTDFETPVVSALVLLQLDARKHCLHQRDLLHLLFLQGVACGIKLGLEHAAAQLRHHENKAAATANSSHPAQ